MTTEHEQLKDAALPPDDSVPQAASRLLRLRNGEPLLDVYPSWNMSGAAASFMEESARQYRAADRRTLSDAWLDEHQQSLENP